MQTPWGRLEDLDLEDAKFAETVLMTDKHQLLEGLVVEREFDRILGAFAQEQVSINILDVETIITLPKKRGAKRIAFVWARSKGPGLGRYLLALEKCFRVFLLKYEPAKGFQGAEISSGKRKDTVSLEGLLAPIAAQKYEPYEANELVRDEQRQTDAIRKSLFEDYGSDAPQKLLLPRLLINCGIQPWFRAVWNLDRIALIDENIWNLELKHKFPYRQSVLKFGLNNGELENIKLLASAGINSVHSIMVKPVWSKNISSLYIHDDNTKAKQQTAIIARTIDLEFAIELQERRVGKSGAHTTLSGSKGSYLKFKPIEAWEFYRMGVLANNETTVRQNLLDLVRVKSDAPAVSDDYLDELKMSEEELSAALASQAEAQSAENSALSTSS